VPATPTTQGSITYYFDGQPTTDAFTYGFYDCNSPPGQPIDGTKPWKFGVLDCQQQVLILNTPVGTDQFRIYDVTSAWSALLTRRTLPRSRHALVPGTHAPRPWVPIA
jgi:hypothetical protein